MTITFNTGYNPAPPPNTVQLTAVTLFRTGAATIAATSDTRDTSTSVVTASVATPASVTFGPNTWSLSNGFTMN